MNNVRSNNPSSTPSRRRLALLSALLGFTFLLAAGPVQAQDVDLPNPEKNVDVPAEQVEAVQAAALASNLVDYGLQNEDPASLVTAARILAQYGVQTSPATEENDEDVDAGADKERRDVPFTAEGLLDAARQMSGGSDAISAQIADVESMMNEMDEGNATRGNIFGARSTYDRVLANDTDIWRLGQFTADEYARLIVDGDGDTDLDCFIVDSDGDIVDRDVDYTDYCLLGWTPPYQQSYRLYIRNLGSVWNAYRLAHN